MSNEFTIVDLSNGEEKSYVTEFQLKDRMNFIINPESGDTLDQFQLLRNKKTWFIIRPDLEGKYTVQALKFIGDTLIGWNSEYEQMKMVDGFIDREELIMDTLSNVFHIKAEKTEMVDLFSEILEGLEKKYVLIRGEEELDFEEVQLESIKTDEYSGEDLISNMYPVPVSEILHLKLSVDGNYYVEVLSTSGEQVYKNELAGNKIDMDLSELKDGVYLLLIKNSEDQVLSSRKFSVSR